MGVSRHSHLWKVVVVSLALSILLYWLYSWVRGPGSLPGVDTVQASSPIIHHPPVQLKEKSPLLPDKSSVQLKEKSPLLPDKSSVKFKEKLPLLGDKNSVKFMEGLPLFRDLYQQEAWPEISRDVSVMPDKVPSTVHYVWCGQNQVFRFEHYLGFLSTLRLLKPLKVVFHYASLPVPDRLWYHIWFWELKQSVALLELRPLGPHSPPCSPPPSQQLAGWVLDLLSRTGGLYIATGAIMTRIPPEMTQQPFGFSTLADGSPALVFAARGFGGDEKLEFSRRLQSKGRNCSSVMGYNRLGAVSGPPCLQLTNQLRPNDIMTLRTPFGELARWLYYGKRRVLEAKRSSTSSIPRMAHITWLLRPGASSSRKFEFYHFLSVLSALHVAGLRHVYVHGDVRPIGEWWEKLRGENVTFVHIEPITQVFQQSVRLPAHRSDILRAHILRTHGGVYMDGDVFWVNRLPDELLAYPTVACPDWPSRGEWPAAFNIGVLMSQSDSPWLRHFLATMRRYMDSIWYFNGIMMPYRTYETYPESLHIDYHLQVICFRGNCHPTWHDDYIRDISDPRPPQPYDWREARAYHFTVPKPPKSVTSADNIKKGSDMFAQMGRLILTKSGRGALIGEK